jgi:hypothetical protein
MRLRFAWTAATFILVGLVALPLISAVAPPKKSGKGAGKANQEPAAKFKVIYKFQGGADGSQPMSDLTLDSAGNLYGTTSSGGDGNECVGGCGTVFELVRTGTGWEEKVLYRFTGGTDGAGPVGGVIFDSSGNLYGMAGGGSERGGTVFKLTPTSHGEWKIRTLYNLPFEGGPSPKAGVTFDSHGNLYGTTFSTVFELTPNSDGTWTGMTLHTFQGTPDGQFVSSPVIVDSAGNVYGVTEGGGTGYCRSGLEYKENTGCGIAYELIPQGNGKWNESILYNFDHGEGLSVYPSGPLLFDKNGNLFGTSRAGGNGYGAVFELHHRPNGTWWQSVVHPFLGVPDGRETDYGTQAVLPRLLPEENGSFFGVNSGYGNLPFDSRSGGGVVFKLQHEGNNWRVKTLHTFAPAKQYDNANGGLVQDAEGNLYGVVKYGGDLTRCYGAGCGTVYEITP